MLVLSLTADNDELLISQLLLIADNDDDDRLTDAVAASGTNNVLAPIQMLARRVGYKNLFLTDDVYYF